MIRVVILSLTFVLAFSFPGIADDRIDSILDDLPWRNIGPAIMGGRIDDFAVVESNPHIIYAATASAGIWKTTNNGVTWRPLFDDQPVSSVGDIAVAATDPSIVWAGTGEPANRQSSSWGNGIYKSTDGGESWQPVGLEDTHHIGRVLIHPKNPDIVYVAALGHLWGPNEERGVFKTTDGGRTWTKTIFINEDTGFIDLAMDPESPDTLYAAAYQRRRRAFGFNGGGPESGIYKTIDGGETWRRLAKGLPEGDTGRIGLDIYRKDPRIVYALVENKDGGTFRSENKGETWTKMSDTNPRPMYYSQVRIDPLNDQRIWVLGAPMYTSDDGGKTFTTERVTRIHGDYHALWINPTDSNHMVLGSDGGIHYSYDRGLTWDFVNSLALGQFYEIGYDMATPYNVYGGLQDNGSWGGPVRTRYEQGITNEDWFRVGGGDGFYTQIDPNDPTTVYVESQNGNLRRLDLKSLETKGIRPEPEEDEPPYRFDWNSPILISPHDSKTVYYGGNRLFRSTNRGDEWTRSADLTKNLDRDEMPIMGVMLDDETLSRNDGISTFGQITVISESPLRAGVVYVGTDDGNLQVTRDGGETWSNVAANLNGVPERTYVTRVVASAHAEGRVYATLDGHRNDDFRTYALRSDDFGASWRSITEGIPEGHTLNVVREHPRNESLLFAGGEFGAYVSFDGGGGWHELSGSIPRVPVDDIAIHPRENDLILGTHGRSIWVLDDMTPLEELSEDVLSAELHVFPIREAVSYRIYRHKGNTGHKMFLAENPPPGALIYFYLGSEPAEEQGPMMIRVKDESGQLVREIELEAESSKGIHRANWDLRHQEPIPGDSDGGFRGPPPGPRALPGTYTIELTLGELTASQSVVVRDDPKVSASDADRRAQRDTLLEIGGLLFAMHDAHERAADLKQQLAELKSSLDDAPDAVTAAHAKATERIDEVEKLLSRNEGRSGFGGGRTPTLFQRLTRLFRNIDGYTEAPSAKQRAQITAWSSELDERTEALSSAVSTEIAELNRTIEEHRLPRIRTDGSKTSTR
jgi:photosystem II stability/assembly factor-like uncharacterized protein